jgi:archaellum component FlaF (FlaF/FlaG flagellin family)
MAGITNNMANLASAKLTANLSASATTATVDDATPYADLGDFYATLMPSSEMGRLSNSEIVLCTYASATSLAITRGQRGTTAKSFSSGDVLANGIYVQDLAQVQAVGNTIFNTSYSSGVYTINSDNDMLPAMPTDGMRITIKVDTNSSGTPKLDLQGLGAEYNINTGTVINGSTTHNAASLKSGQIYELTFNGTSWEAKNIFSGTGTNGLIGTSDIADGAVSNSKLANGAVSNSKIANGAVNAAKLENGAVSTEKVANNAITPAKTSFTKYLNTETIVGTWGGKPIYRKVIHITNPQTSNTDYGIISNAFGILVNLYGYMVGNTGARIPVPQTDSSSTYSVVFVQQNGTLRGRFSFAGAAATEVNVVVEYTKTTD